MRARPCIDRRFRLACPPDRAHAHDAGHEVTLVARRAAGLPTRSRSTATGPSASHRRQATALPGRLRPIARRIRHGLAGEPAADRAPRRAERRLRPGPERSAPAFRQRGRLGRSPVVAMVSASSRSCSRSARNARTRWRSPCEPILSTGWPSWASRWVSTCTAERGGRDLRRSRHLPRRPQPGADALADFGRLRTLRASLGAPADRVITVNDGYAAVMAARWHVEPPLVVMNCPSLGGGSPGSVRPWRSVDSTNGWRSPPGRGSCSTTAGCSRTGDRAAGRGDRAGGCASSC